MFCKTRAGRRTNPIGRPYVMRTMEPGTILDSRNKPPSLMKRPRRQNHPVRSSTTTTTVIQYRPRWGTEKVIHIARRYDLPQALPRSCLASQTSRCTLLRPKFATSISRVISQPDEPCHVIASMTLYFGNMRGTSSSPPSSTHPPPTLQHDTAVAATHRP